MGSNFFKSKSSHRFLKLKGSNKKESLNTKVLDLLLAVKVNLIDINLPFNIIGWTLESLNSIGYLSIKTQ